MTGVMCVILPFMCKSQWSWNFSCTAPLNIADRWKCQDGSGLNVWAEALESRVKYKTGEAINLSALRWIWDIRADRAPLLRPDWYHQTTHASASSFIEINSWINYYNSFNLLMFLKMWHSDQSQLYNEGRCKPLRVFFM